MKISVYRAQMRTLESLCRQSEVLSREEFLLSDVNALLFKPSRELMDASKLIDCAKYLNDVERANKLLGRALNLHSDWQDVQEAVRMAKLTSKLRERLSANRTPRTKREGNVYFANFGPWSIK